MVTAVFVVIADSCVVIVVVMVMVMVMVIVASSACVDTPHTWFECLNISSCSVV